MKLYQCHKKVHAEPMTRGAYNKMRGWQIPRDEDPEDAGYLVVYIRDSKVEYVSWSPADAFEDGYTLIEEDIDE